MCLIPGDTAYAIVTSVRYPLKIVSHCSIFLTIITAMVTPMQICHNALTVTNASPMMPARCCGPCTAVQLKTLARSCPVAADKRRVRHCLLRDKAAVPHLLQQRCHVSKAHARGRVQPAHKLVPSEHEIHSRREQLDLPRA